MQDQRDIEKEQRELNKRDAERLELFRLLVKHPGWLAFEALLNEKLSDMGTDLMQPVARLDDLLPREHQKGSMYGVALARDLPRVMIAADDKARAYAADDGE